MPSALFASLATEKDFEYGEHAGACEHDRGSAYDQVGDNKRGALVRVIGKDRAQPDQRMSESREYEENDQECRHRRREPGSSGRLIRSGEPQNGGCEIESKRNKRDSRQALQTPFPQPIASAAQMTHAPKYRSISQRS